MTIVTYTSQLVEACIQFEDWAEDPSEVAMLQFPFGTQSLRAWRRSGFLGGKAIPLNPLRDPKSIRHPAV